MNEIQDLGAFIKEQNVVAIHAHHGKHFIDILPAAIEYDIPLVVHFRGRDSSTQTFKRFRKNVLRYQDLVKHGAACFSVCHFLADELKKLGFKEDKIHVLYGGAGFRFIPICPTHPT
ncbi:glycosyltransferase [Peribacillus frigoritolerans]|uniref:glycosyltransferase n=1 Tax=Peribacillus frigoritolerans TaxID=450367 RepID=UPI002E1E95F4|nr:glycosyltransferase [Peribacillus frigoritolerans]